MASFVDGLFGLDGRTALVTGASRGIGAAIARAYARAGARVVLTARSQEDLDAVAAQIRDTGAAMAIVADLTSGPDVARLVRTAREAWGPIDILVNNAGIVSQESLFQVSDEEWQAVIDTNLTACFRCARLVAEGMAERRSGKIINILSVRAVKAGPRRGAYAASKAGLLQLTRVMALEWTPLGITVNAIAPGAIETEMSAALLPSPEALTRFVETQVPAGRPGQPDDVVGAAIFLASRAADYVTGQALFVDGGWSVT